MHPHTAVKKSFSMRLALKLVFLVLLGEALASAVVYLTIERSFKARSYTEVFVFSSMFRTEVLRDSLYIYGLFAVLISAGVMVLGLFYSHRVAGPLYRVRRIAKDVAAGDLSLHVKLRKKDVVHPLADSMNRMLDSYRQRHSGLVGSVEKMLADLSALESALKNSEEEKAQAALLRVVRSSQEVDSVLGELRL